MRTVMAVLLVSSSVALLTSCAPEAGPATAVDVIAAPCELCCTFTPGYWKNHPEAWPVPAVKLGNKTYTQAQALAIFDTPVAGNGLIALAHQLMATKLNARVGPSCYYPPERDVADALIGALVVPPIGTDKLLPRQTSGLVEELTAFNESNHCAD